MAIVTPVKGAVNFDNIPAYFKSRTQWVMWKYVQRKQKYTKAPYQPNGRPAKSNDPSTWSDFQDCVEALASGQFDGIGFMFAKGDSLVGIDLDHCYDSDGHLEPWAQVIVDQCAGTYIEKSPSGDGLHIWCLGIPLDTGSKKWKKPGTNLDQGIEVYNQGRYFTVTGAKL